MSENIPGRRKAGDEPFYTDWMRRTGDGILIPVEDLKIIGPAVAPALETQTESDGALPTPVSLDTPLLVQTARGLVMMCVKEFRRQERTSEVASLLPIRPSSGPGDSSEASQQSRS